MSDRGRINFDNPTGNVFPNDERSDEIIASDWTVLEEVKGVRFRTWKYKEISDEIVDGALVEVSPGYRTPVQYVETDHVFDENIQLGKFLLFHLTTDGLSVYKYDSSVGEVSFSLQVHRGELMCLYVMKDSNTAGEIIECEKPGFSSAKLVTIPEGTTMVEELRIPDEFWRAIKMLDEGTEEGLPVDIFDVNEEI